MHIILALLLILTSTPNGASFVVTAAHDGPLYIEVSAEGGAQLQSSTVYQVDLKAGESFGHAISASGPGRIHVRVWDGASQPSADQVIALPGYVIYLPLASH